MLPFLSFLRDWHPNNGRAGAAAHAMSPTGVVRCGAVTPNASARPNRVGCGGLCAQAGSARPPLVLVLVLAPQNKTIVPVFLLDLLTGVKRAVLSAVQDERQRCYDGPVEMDGCYSDPMHAAGEPRASLVHAVAAAKLLFTAVVAVLSGSPAMIAALCNCAPKGQSLVVPTTDAMIGKGQSAPRVPAFPGCASGPVRFGGCKARVPFARITEQSCWVALAHAAAVQRSCMQAW